MGLGFLLALAFGLAMDAFAVAIGVSLENENCQQLRCFVFPFFSGSSRQG